jgi:hypothetical protein
MFDLAPAVLLPWAPSRSQSHCCRARTRCWARIPRSTGSSMTAVRRPRSRYTPSQVTFPLSTAKDHNFKLLWAMASPNPFKIKHLQKKLKIPTEASWQHFSRIGEFSSILNRPILSRARRSPK